MNHSRRQDCPEYQKLMANRGDAPEAKTLREQMLSRMDGQIERKRDQLSPLAAVSHIARGGSFESIKDRVELSCKAITDSRERVRWIQVIAGALQVAICIENSSIEPQLQKMAEFTDEIFCTDFSAIREHRAQKPHIKPRD